MARGRAQIFSGAGITRTASTVLFAPGTPIQTRTGVFTPGPAIQPPASGGTSAPSPNDSAGSGILGDLLNRAGRAAADRLGRELENRINPMPSGGGSIPLSPSGFQPTAGNCPDGRIRIRGQCVDITAALPGGEPLTIPAGGTATMGAFGLPAVTPTIVGQRNGRPIRQCPTGLVLGKDDMCYAGLPNRFRKWPKKAKPPVTAADMKAIRRADRTKTRVKKLAGNVGFTCKKR